jgi:multidrug resistance efflux pump
MLTLFSTLASFLMGGLPKLFDLFQDRSDKAHELALASMQTERELALKKAGLEAQERIEHIQTEQIQINADVTNAQTALAERQALYAHDIAIGQGAAQWVTNARAMV